MGHLDFAVDQPDLVDQFDIGGQPTVDAEDTAVDYGTDWKVVEYVGAEFPGVRVAVFSDNLVVEPVGLRDLAGLVVAPQESDVGWVFNLQAHHILKSFH
jgi:hypothetical protein